MDLGAKVSFLRKCKGLTQQELGESIGFTKKNARIRIAQYEANDRMPRKDLVNKLAEVLTVDPLYLTTPAEYSSDELMHIFFTLESARHINIEVIDGKPYLEFDSFIHDKELLLEWYVKRQQLLNNEISIKEYSWWKYRYPKKATDFKDASDTDPLDYDPLNTID